MPASSQSPILHLLWQRARRFEDRITRWDCLAEIAASLAFAGERETMESLWLQEFETISTLASAQEQGLALNQLARRVAQRGSGQGMQPLWQRLIDMAAGFEAETLRSRSLASVASMLLSSRDVLNTCPLVQMLFQVHFETLRQDAHFQSLLGSLIAWLARSRELEVAALWQLARDQLAGTDSLVPRALLLAQLADSLARAGQPGQALQTATEVLDLCETHLNPDLDPNMDVDPELPPEPQQGLDQGQINEILSRLFSQLSEAAFAAASDDSSPADTTPQLWQGILTLLARVGELTLSQTLQRIGAELVKSRPRLDGSASAALLQPLWCQSLERAFALADPILAAKAAVALAGGWQRVGTRELALEAYARVLERLAGCSGGPSRNLLLIAMARSLAQMPPDDSPLWQRLLELSPATGGPAAELRLWRAVTLAATGDSASAAGLLDEALAMGAAIGWRPEKQALMQSILEALALLDIDAPIDAQGAQAALLPPFQAAIRAIESLPPTPQGISFKPLFARLLQQGREGMLLTALAALDNDETRSHGMILIMEELIQTRGLEKRPPAFYQRLQDMARALGAWYYQVRVRLWLTAGMSDSQLRTEGRQCFADALTVSGQLPAGPLQNQLLMEAMVCLGISSRKLDGTEFWEEFLGFVSQLPEGDERSRLMICLAGALAMAGEAQQAVVVSSRIGSEGFQAMALRGIAQAIREAGGR